MPRNIDETLAKEDREFIIRGETFKVVHVHYSVLEQIDELQRAFTAKGTEATWKDTFEFVNGRLELLLDDGNGQAEKWRELVERKKDPVSFAEIQELSRWAMEMSAQFPTVPPSPSAPSRTSIKATSRDA